MRQARFGLLLALLTTVVLGATAHAAPVGAHDCALSAEVRRELLKAWDIARPHLKREVEAELPSGNPSVLYLLAQYTHPLIGAARDCGMHAQLDELAALYALPFEQLQPTSRGGERFRAWPCSGPQCPAWRSDGAGEPYEVILYSAQFLYAASTLINAIGLLPASQRTPAMLRMGEHAPFIADTYARWLSSTGEPLYPAGVRAATSALLLNTYRTDDKQLQIAGGIVELLCATDRADDQLGIGPARQSELREYAALYWRLIESRARFDAGGRVTYDEAWGSVARALCASHTGASPPGAAQCTGAATLSLDLGHFARVPAVIESYDRCGQADGRALLDGLARQFADRVWNGDIANPRFFNYFSGAGMYGWYNRTFDANGRVRSGGWAPLALSNKAPAYFHLGRVNPRVARIAAAYLSANRNSLRVDPRSDMERVLYVLAALPGFVE